MRAYVYTDAALDRYAGRFVWLSINTEDAKNAAFLKHYPIPALPTLLVLDAKRDDVTSRYVGGATVPQLRKILDDAEKTYRARAQSESDKLLVKAEGLAAAGKNEEAVKLYEQALAGAPKSWPKFGRTAESMLFSMMMAGQEPRCAARAIELYARVKGTSSAANVASTGLGCAASMDKADASRAKLIETLERDTREVFDDPKLTMSDDDRSGLYIALIEARDTAGDDEAVAALQSQWAAFLEGAAARAKTPEQRAVYDSHRLSAYLDLGTPEKAVPMLEQSERDFPDDYNPPARLAVAYKEMKEYDKALAASDRALAKVYGPRKLTVLTTRADIFTAKGDPKAARETMMQAIEFAKSLPEGQRNERRIAGLEKKLAAMPQ